MRHEINWQAQRAQSTVVLCARPNSQPLGFQQGHKLNQVGINQKYNQIKPHH